ncbi:probable alpha-glucoside transport protein [Rhynchosporium agropyri]|uniref:Probable alpha-glucoside transport protein n=3 Tax=Rhynchosporium TaxID=38037 RepID=A0A1E1MTL9_RHYSE|nr:probable alpha-glucoside transport protein [Rhynchosporium commune]CZT00904.1 probable alpha-glucoside transport protein [Rhynchosporium agropyri]CZT52145.1 probable alpha-glucoside transport protein [Rhynchosporium secalis]
MANDIPEPVGTMSDSTIEKAPQAQHTEHALNMPGKHLDDSAKAATATEHNTTVWQGIKTYRKAVFWSVLVSASIIMEGYDTTLISSFFAYPSFKQKYGTYSGPKYGYQLSAPWQTGLQDIQAVGNIIGALGNGYFTHKYGHRMVMMVSLVMMTGFIFITFFAPNVECLLVGAFLCSIPWGTFATMGPAYAMEVCPLVLRGYLAAFVNLCWAIGQLLSAAILKALVNNKTQWSYRIPFALQWIWVLPLFIAAYFCPESPWHLVRQNRLEEAEQSLQRLSQGADNVDHQATIALMLHTTRLEEQEELGTSYFDCFKGTNLRRTEIACVAFLSQVTNGGAFAYSPTYFFEQAGIQADTSYSIGLGGTGIAFCGTVISWFIMNRVGRRPIFLTGFCGMVFCLFLIGILACVPGVDTSTTIKYVQASLCLVWLGTYSMTVGPIVYTIVAEIGATRLRTKTVVLGRSTYYVGNIVGGVLQPYMMNPTKWNFKGKTAFFWASLATITTVWAWFRLPETKDRTFEELDVLFLRGVPTRKFAKADLEDEE